MIASHYGDIYRDRLIEKMSQSGWRIRADGKIVHPTDNRVFDNWSQLLNIAS